MSKTTVCVKKYTYSYWSLKNYRINVRNFQTNYTNTFIFNSKYLSKLKIIFIIKLLIWTVDIKCIIFNKNRYYVFILVCGGQIIFTQPNTYGFLRYLGTCYDLFEKMLSYPKSGSIQIIWLI